MKKKFNFIYAVEIKPPERIFSMNLDRYTNYQKMSHSAFWIFQSFCLCNKSNANHDQVILQNTQKIMRCCSLSVIYNPLPMNQLHLNNAYRFSNAMYSSFSCKAAELNYNKHDSDINIFYFNNLFQGKKTNTIQLAIR